MVGTNVAVQNHQTKLRDIYGVTTAIDPQRQYHIKTTRGTVLIKNRRLIRRRVPASVPYFKDPEETSTENAQLPQPRQSHGDRKPTQRLIEDPNWPFTSLTTVVSLMRELQNINKDAVYIQHH